MLTDKEKRHLGLAHQPYDPELAEMRLRNKELLHEYNVLTRPSDKQTKARLILFLVKLRIHLTLMRLFTVITGNLLKSEKTFLRIITVLS